MTTLHALDMPRDDSALPGWLESQLAGPHLGELAAELTALGEQADVDENTTTLQALFGNHLESVRRQGLAGIPARTLRRCLQQPALLLELQEQILADPSDFWDARLRSSGPLSAAVDSGQSRLQSSLGKAGAVLKIAAESRPSEKRARPVRWFLAGLATAAAIAVAAIAIRDRGQPTVAATGWGWNRPDAFPAGVTRAEYLNALAEAAGEWRKKRPDKPAELAQRISEFRRGCTQLILAEHKPLPRADRDWLVERCRVWSKKLDEHLVDVESGKDVAAVRRQADETVDRLIKAVRDRAAAAA